MINKNVTPAKADGNPKKGNGKPYAKLPANNVGTMPLPKLGSHHGSSIVANSMEKGVAPAKQTSKGKQNLPTHNDGSSSIQMGTTKHSVGSVPAYLKGK